MPDQKKTHASAVCVIPPESAWDPIQKIRRKYDRQVRRWMPHINLLYPFRPPEAFDEAVEILGGVCAAVAPFSLTLSTLRSFSHRRGNATMWLEPRPADPLVNLQAALLEGFPDCNDTSRFPDGFTPHLSVGQAKGRAQLEGRLKDLQQDWTPLTFTVREAALIHRRRKEPFHVAARLPFSAPLSGSSPVHNRGP